MQSFLNYIACGFIGGLLVVLFVAYTPVVSYAPRPMMNTGLGQSDNNSYALFAKHENASRNGKWGYWAEI